MLLSEPRTYIVRRGSDTACRAAVAFDEDVQLCGGDAFQTEGWVKARHVPYILATHDCIFGIASGMTAKCATSD